jgi:hypothetical protein
MRSCKDMEDKHPKVGCTRGFRGSLVSVIGEGCYES